MIETEKIRETSWEITAANRWDHFLARWGVRRSKHHLQPGLYALGKPTPDSPVFVTANYTLSFDALRAALEGTDSYILVLDTKGINVWCAAGKGTFGTATLTYYINRTGLKDVVSHRRLILPQLAAPGVAAHQVKRRTGFNVEYGPIRSVDIPQYLRTGKVTEAMRTVRFNLLNRAVLIPVELVSVFLIMLGAGAAFYFLGGWLAAAAAASAFIAGTVLFPLLLPWIPTRDFSSKGLLLGGLVALGFALGIYFTSSGAWYWKLASALSYLFIMPAVTAFLALNFTGSTTFTSKTGVKREMFTYIPVMAWLFGTGLVLTIFDAVTKIAGVVR